MSVPDWVTGANWSAQDVLDPTVAQVGSVRPDPEIGGSPPYGTTRSSSSTVTTR